MDYHTRSPDVELADAVYRSSAELCEAMRQAASAGLEVYVLLKVCSRIGDKPVGWTPYIKILREVKPD